ncbi:Hypp3153 [Branchiostoma lanceolatum]|uniref:F-box DNA helicase 1 n=1 Tax=Branchiostoma lanceolatum TaxID=7740 RepID=A0A8J9ZZT0_BRALA|nr:Hypp3153 [Branchiostoma lanceolatum]
MECGEVLEEQQFPKESPGFLPGGPKDAVSAEFEDLRIPPPPKMASTDPPELAQTQTSEEAEPQQKRRKINMDPGACLKYSNSEVGANPLKNPLSVKKSSRNINDILMPRKPRGDNGRKMPTSSGRVFTNTRFRTASTFPAAKPRSISTQGANLAMNRMKNSTMDNYFMQDSRVPKSPCTSSPEKVAHSSKRQNLKRPGTHKTSTTTTESYLRTPTKNNVPFSMSSPGGGSQRVSPGSLRVSPGSRIFKWPAKNSSVPITTSPDMTTHIFMSSPDKGTVRAHSSSPSQSSSPGQTSTSNSLTLSDGNSDHATGRVVRNIFGKAAADSGGCSKAMEVTSSVQQVQSSTKDEQQLPSLDDSELDNLLANYDMEQCTSQQRTDHRNKFGLFGVSSGCHGNDDDSSDSVMTSEEQQNPFEMLPEELLENIFCQMPMLDLCLHLSLVCRQWRDIVQRETFIPWKKKYHMLKQGCPETVQEVNFLMGKHNITATKDGCLLQLIRYMSSWQKREEAAILDRMRAHPMAAAAQDLIRSRAADCLKDGACPAWSVAVAVVILASSVSDIQTLLRLLTRHPTPCMVVDVLEGLYCIATLLFALRRHFNINLGLHYRLYYTLYLYENASSVSCGQLTTLQGKHRGQQTMMRYRSAKDTVRLSHEQLRIINHELKPRETIKIIAFAGTGKTTTLVEYTKLRPHLKFLMLAFNKSVQEHADKLFPGNVVCKTVHSLAYKACGFRFRGKMAFSLKTESVARNLTNHSRYNYVFAKYVLDTLSSYIASVEDVVTTAHVPEMKPGPNMTKIPIPHQEKMQIAEEAQLIWDRMSDPADRDVYINHDGYLKVYQLSRPQITEFDCLLIDEAQDLTPAINDILLNQDVAKILVGDPHQQIYTFRGARNAMQGTACTHTYYLTQSFRFGPEIAYVAACLLDVLKGVRKKTLVGSSKTGNVMGRKQGQEAVICRMNSTLFNEAVRLTNPNRLPIRIAFAGGLAGYQLGRILDIYYLSLTPAQRVKENVSIKDKFIGNFASLWKLKEFAERAQDVELSGKIRIVETHRHDTPKFIKRIRERATDNMSLADVVLTSAHKAKGLEFDTVRLADDFCGGTNPIGLNPWANMDEDEKNLLYVAATRAKKSLLLTSTVMLALKDVQEQFIYPELTKDLVNKGVTLTCNLPRCGQTIPADNLLTMNRRMVTYGTGHETPNGPQCPKCSKKPAPGFRNLLCEPCPGESDEEEEEEDDDIDMDFFVFAVHYNPH